VTPNHLEAPGPEAAVLVIDPDPASAAALRPVLADAGLAGRVDEASSLAEGLDALARGPYLLVLLALATGDAEGVESLARIRAIDPEVPVVLTSDVDDRNLAHAALRRGAQDFALKEDLVGRAAVRILGHAVERQRILLELQEARRREQYLATHDPLTGVPNRTLFYDRLGQALAAADRYRTTLAVLFVDLDGFKEVNDELGHEAGDELLCEVARRVSGLVRKSDTVARVGGDEFTVVLSQIGKAEDAARVARNLLERLSVPVRLAGQERRVAASIGIAVHPGDGEAADTLVRNADAAMYAAKRAGGGRYAFHDRGPRRDDESAP
jgi:diguanylate cyclase (GGDEF)-like protein